MLKLRLILVLIFIVTACRVMSQKVPGRLDSSFVPSGLKSGDAVFDIVIQDDNKILFVDQSFVVMGPNRYVRRLNSDGSKDISFNIPVINTSEWDPSPVGAVALQHGRILLGGSFNSINGVAAGGLVRLNEDGTLDTGFNRPTIDASIINVLVVQPDGKIIIGGRFYTVNSQPMTHLARLNSNGTLDAGFHSVISRVGASSVHAALLEPSGSIVVAGPFYAMDDFPSMSGGIVRIKSDGTLDKTFTAPVSYTSGLHALAQDSSGRLLFATGSSKLKPLVRLLSNGAIDPTFNIGSGPNDRLRKIAVQPDDKIIVIGDFTIFAGKPRKFVARLNSDGSLDDTFDTSDGPDHWLFSLALQKDERILIGGNFESIEGVSRFGLARLFGGDPMPVGPSLIVSPQALSIELGDNAVFEVTASGFPLYYQWFKNSESIAGATNSTLTLFNASELQNGVYHVSITNAIGHVASPLVGLQVTAPLAATNLILNPSFELTSDSPSKPNSHYFFGVAEWEGIADLFRYPADAPRNFMGYQMPLHGSNYVGFSCDYFLNSGWEYLRGGALTGRLAQATVPGKRYEMSARVALAELSGKPDAGIEVIMANFLGESLSLGMQTTANATAWDSYRSTFITSKAYDRIILRRAKTPSQTYYQTYLYIDKLTLVEAPNEGPVFEPIPNQLAEPGRELIITNRLTGTDILENAFEFSLDGGAPENMAIYPQSGVIRWTPSLTQAGKTNLIIITASNIKYPTQKGWTTATIAVSDAVKLGFGEVWLREGERGSVPIMLHIYDQSNTGVTNLSFKLQFPAIRFENMFLTNMTGFLGVCSLSPLNSTSAVVRLAAASGQTLPGDVVLANIGFDTVSNLGSGIFSFKPAEIECMRADGRKTAITIVETGRIGIVGREPLLGIKMEGPTRRFTLYGRAGVRYRLESAFNLSPAAAWKAIGDVTIDDFYHDITGFDTNLPMLFLRARELP
jgi:uncharacterized delta-60 repeat protein